MKERLKVAQPGEKLHVINTENGVVRDFSANNLDDSPVLGLSLIGEFHALKEKFYNQRFSSYIRGLKIVQGTSAGTSVHIII